MLSEEESAALSNKLLIDGIDLRHAEIYNPEAMEQYWASFDELDFKHREIVQRQLDAFDLIMRKQGTSPSDVDDV